MDTGHMPHDGERVFCSSALVRLYQLVGRRSIRSVLRRWIIRWEGGEGRSLTIRQILRKYYDVEVGLHTEGPCRVNPMLFHRGTSIGRYAFIADTVRTFTCSHPRNTRSSHGVFRNPALGWVKNGPPIQFNELSIGHGTRLEHNVIVLPPTRRIGDGAIVLAGSVVYNDVPPYAIVSGNPARVTGFRFNKEMIAVLLESRWWEKSPEELAEADNADTSSYCQRWLAPASGETSHNPSECCSATRKGS